MTITCGLPATFVIILHITIFLNLMPSLKSQKHKLSNYVEQVHILESTTNGSCNFSSFQDKLETIGLWPFKPTTLEILQINIGKMCNQTCGHCHVDAGPDRKEIMARETMQLCLNAIRNSPIQTVDITGGAPEMNPNFKWLIEEIRKINNQIRIIVRSNLTILTSNKKYTEYPTFFAENNITIVSSLPCYTAENTDKQRGSGVFSHSIEALRRLNKVGYGNEDSELELHLVYNPLGPFLPPPQEKLQEDYKKHLFENFGIVFNDLYTITNLPISRFLDYLIKSEEYEEYMELLIKNFNSSAAVGVMCRNTISVGWDGFLYDCDFNQMLDMKLDKTQHVSNFNERKLAVREIKINKHCFGCTAGAGSSCQGALT